MIYAVKVKALVSFSGIITMTKDEVRDIANKEIYEDLLRAKYVEKVKSPNKKVVSDED